MEVIETNEAEVKLMNDGLSLIKTAGTLVISDDNQLSVASGALKQIAAHLKKIDAWFNPMISDANKVHKGLTGRKKEAKAKPTEVYYKLRAGMSVYVTRQEQIRAAELEKARKEYEAAQEELKLEAAQKAEEAGEPELADALLEQPAPKATAVIPAMPKQEGISYRENWTHEVADLMLLVKAVAAGEVSMNAIKADDVFLGGQVKTLKNDFAIPGVMVHCEKIPVLR